MKRQQPTEKPLPACRGCGVEWLPGHECDINILERHLNALRRIVNHQIRSDRRMRGMVDIDEVADLQRIASVALNAKY